MSKKREKQFLWVEKYRPSTLEDCIIPQKTRDEFSNLLSKGQITNLLLSGPPGTGKTSVARVLCDMINATYMIINASKDGNIDTLRTKITNFASTRTIDNSLKVVILDEADYLNVNSTQPALRNFIEEYSNTCRFILTCNKPKRIMEPLRSRLREVDFSFTKEERKTVAQQFAKRICFILKTEGVKFTKEAVILMVRKYAPDYRKIINEMQNLSVTGELNTQGIGTISDDFGELALNISKRKFTFCREWVGENNNLEFSDFLRVLNHLEPLMKKESIPELFMILNEFDTSSKDCTDLEVHLTACIARLMFDLEYK